MSHTINVAVVQQACGGDKQANLQRTVEAIEQAASQGAQLVVLQELHATPYFCQTEATDNFDLAEPIPGPSTQLLAQAARANQVVVVGSVFEQRAPGLYHNTAVVLEKDGSLVGKYRKMHIPDDPGYYEKFYFTPGDLGFHPVSTSVGKLGVLVCWDQWFPEAARLMTLAGADMLVYPTAIGWSPADDSAEQKRQQDAWFTVQRGHAVANGIPVIVANRTGFEADPSGNSAGIRFWGTSFIAGPQGEILGKAAEDTAALLVQRVDRARVDAVRRIWPFLRDRRIEEYADLLKRFRD